MQIIECLTIRQNRPNRGEGSLVATFVGEYSRYFLTWTIDFPIRLTVHSHSKSCQKGNFVCPDSVSAEGEKLFVRGIYHAFTRNLCHAFIGNLCHAFSLRFLLPA